MSLSERSERATEAIIATLRIEADEAQRRTVAEIIDQALASATREAGESATQAVMVCCSPDLDIAHKIADEIRRREKALVANLSSLR